MGNDVPISFTFLMEDRGATSGPFPIEIIQGAKGQEERGMMSLRDPD